MLRTVAVSALQKQISKLNLIHKINYHSNFYYATAGCASVKPE